MRNMYVGAGLTALILAGAATPALAASDPKLVAEKNNGVGICMSQIAIQPELVGADRLGQEARNRFSNVGGLEGLRNACGGPPGPGHLG
jgi:hypothetical protein